MRYPNTLQNIGKSAALLFIGCVHFTFVSKSFVLPWLKASTMIPFKADCIVEFGDHLIKAQPLGTIVIVPQFEGNRIRRIELRCLRTSCASAEERQGKSTIRSKGINLPSIFLYGLGTII